ncbi:mynd domain [Diplodia corticola]|uniref:Mynd domain n=1 Tax=Diplodia corticola TaxID=236234 RepID=A0A1J9R5X4_9PEZI|nr:mynd domain [Diplodia corticola]OJD35953.1 mynd domain [Diplodia corticola]
MDKSTEPTPMDIDDPSPSPTAATRLCHSCHVSEFVLPCPLFHCTRCKQTLYCSRTCQHADWKSHKKTCDKNRAAARNNNKNTPSPNPNPTHDDNNNPNPNADHNDFPFATRTTLPSILLKTYLLRLHDEHNLSKRLHHNNHLQPQPQPQPKPPTDTLLSPHGNPLHDYRRFLDRAEAAAAAGALALPTWYWRHCRTDRKNNGGAGGDMSDMRRACERLAKYGGVVEGEEVLNLFESGEDVAAGQFGLGRDGAAMEEALRGLAVKICGNVVV